MATYDEMPESVKADMRRACRATPNAVDIAASLGLLRSQAPLNEQYLGDPSQDLCNEAHDLESA